MMTIAIWVVAVLTSVATPTAVYQRTASSSAEVGQPTTAAQLPRDTRADADGFSQYCVASRSTAWSTITMPQYPVALAHSESNHARSAEWHRMLRLTGRDPDATSRAG